MKFLKPLYARLPRAPFPRGFLLAIEKLSRRLLAPNSRLTYSQFGEDAVLRGFLGPIQKGPGVYVDVGCNAPIHYSNTYGLYLAGWSGLVVDGNLEHVRQFRKDRPRDHAVCAVVSDLEAELEFFAPKDSTLIAGVGAKTEGHWQRTAENSTVTRVMPQRLDTLLQSANIQPGFDLLCVDVEGHEMNVLNSFDITFWRPRLCVIEVHGMDIGSWRADLVCTHLAAAGYDLVGYLDPNAYFAFRTEV